MGIPDEGQLVELQLPDGEVVKGRKISGRWIKEGDPKHAPGLQIQAWRAIEKKREEAPVQTRPARKRKPAKKAKGRRR